MTVHALHTKSSARVVRQDRQRPQPPPLVAERAADVILAPSPREIVEGVAWAGCVTVLVGESGAGKTFVLHDLEAAVSVGRAWHGRATVEGTVLHVAFEGDAIGRRLRALRDVHGYRLDRLYVLRASAPLSPLAGREGDETRSRGEIALVAAIETLRAQLDAAGDPAIVLLVIDTIRASMNGSEDSSEHVAAYLRAVRRLLLQLPGAAVVLAHHAGWQDGEQQRKRERGSSAWRGNSDATLYLEAGPYDAGAGEATLTLRTLKARDAERPAPLSLIRRRVDLDEMGRRGQPVTSCVIDRDRRTREDREAEARAVADREAEQFDQRVLRLIHETPAAATSLDRVRVALHARKALISESVGRLITGGLVVPGRRGEPYTLTDAGRTTLTHQGEPA